MQRSFWQLASPVHSEAVLAQSRYISAVARASTCLFIGFCAFAASVTPAGQTEHAKILLVWFEVLAIALLGLHVYYGRIANKKWIWLRSTTELLRQYSFLATSFPGATTSGSQASDITSRFEDERRLIQARFKDASTESELVGVIADYWASRRNTINGAIMGEHDLTVDAFLMYLKARALRQLGWFVDSRARLEGNAHRRGRWLRALYFITALLTLIKLAFVLFGGHEGSLEQNRLPSYSYSMNWLDPVLSAALLILTGLSATLAAYYLNQNSRSLSHRYSAQERKIAGWLADLDTSISFGTLVDRTLSEREKREVRAFILDFEDIMIEELLDWIHITDRDVIEIAP